MSKVLAFNCGICVGHGYIIFHNGRIYAPDLYALDGGELPEGGYNLQIQDEQRIIVINKTIQ